MWVPEVGFHFSNVNFWCWDFCFLIITSIQYLTETSCGRNLWLLWWWCHRFPVQCLALYSGPWWGVMAAEEYHWDVHFMVSRKQNEARGQGPWIISSSCKPYILDVSRTCQNDTTNSGLSIVGHFVVKPWQLWNEWTLACEHMHIAERWHSWIQIC